MAISQKMIPNSSAQMRLYDPNCREAACLSCDSKKCRSHIFLRSESWCSWSRIPCQWASNMLSRKGSLNSSTPQTGLRMNDLIDMLWPGTHGNLPVCGLQSPGADPISSCLRWVCRKPRSRNSWRWVHRHFSKLRGHNNHHHHLMG